MYLCVYSRSHHCQSTSLCDIFEQAMYFNAYLEDAKRPQLPEHPSNTMKAPARRHPPGEMGPPQGPPGGYGGGGPMMGPPQYGGNFRGGFRGGFDQCKNNLLTTQVHYSSSEFSQITDLSF